MAFLLKLVLKFPSSEFLPDWHQFSALQVAAETLLLLDALQ